MERLNDPTPKELDHEEMRIKSMGERVAQRIKTIRKAKKMFAFALALEIQGMNELANQAYKKLREMGFTHTGRPVRA